MLRQKAKEYHEKVLLAEKDDRDKAAFEAAKQEFLKGLTDSKIAEMEDQIRNEITHGVAQ